MKQVTLKSVGELPVGAETFCHKVKISRTFVREEEMELYVVTTSDKLSADDDDALFDAVEHFDWRECNNYTENEEVCIISTQPGPTAGRCPNTPDMFKSASSRP